MVDPTRLRELIKHSDGACITLMLPTARTGREVWQAPIRFKNLMREVEQQVAQLPDADPAMRHILGTLTAEVEANGFWEHPREGLILLAGNGVHEAWRVPFEVPEYAHVGQRFHLKQALHVASSPAFELLCFSRGSVRAYRADASHVEQLDVPGLLPDLATFLQIDEKEEQLQSHATRSEGPHARPGVVIHGHGAGHDDRIDELQRFAKAVAHSVEGRRRALPRAPALVLAATRREGAAYRAASQDAGLLAHGLEGNFDEARPDELRRRGWELVAARWHEELHRDATFVREGIGAGFGSTALRAVLGAAHQGRIRTLFVAGDAEHWGRFTPDDGKLETSDGPAPGYDALFDQAACFAFRNGAKVHVVPSSEVPGGQGVAAVFYETT